MILREVFQSDAEAQRAAEAKRTELRSGEGELELHLIGDPKARAEAPIQVSGVAADVDGKWVSSTVTHTWSFSGDSGATTVVEAEFGKDDETAAEPAAKTTTVERKSPTGEYVSVLDR